MARHTTTVGRGTGRAAAGVLCVIGAMAGPGCALSKTDPRETLRPSDFAGPAGTSAEPTAAPVATGARVSERATASEAREGLVDVVARPGAPSAGEAEAAPKGGGVLVDGTAGYVNNKAIYFNDFLAPMADRLRSAAREMTRDQWINGRAVGGQAEWEGARARIRQSLNLLINDELLRAEAMAQLLDTEDKRRGLMAYFDQKRGSILSHFGGTESAANDALAQREEAGLPDFGSDIQGKSVDEVLDAIKKRELIEYQLRSRVAPRSYVPWRDVEYAYERDYKAYNRSPIVLFRMISVDARKPEAVNEVASRLAAGEDFGAVASGPPNEYKASTGGRYQPDLMGPIETSPIFSIPELDQAAHKLKVGETVGPITFKNDCYWIKFEEMHSRSMGLYEAQLQLENQLRKRRYEDELVRHMTRLKERASFTDVDEMTERLLAAALERFYPEGARPEPAPRAEPARPARRSP